VKYYAFVTFDVLPCPGYTFFSGPRPARTPARILTVYGLNDESSPKHVAFGDMMTTHNLKEFKHPKKHPNKGAWLVSFQPNWQNHKTAISPTAKIGSTPNFDRIIEPHS